MWVKRMWLGLARFIVRRGQEGTCRHVRANLIAYQYGALSPRHKASITRHLDQCDACQQALNESRNLEQELRWEAARSRPLLPPEASARIQQAVYRRMRRALFLQRTWRMTNHFASVSLTLLLAITVFLFAQQMPSYTRGGDLLATPGVGSLSEIAPAQTQTSPADILSPAPSAFLAAPATSPLLVTPHGLNLPPDALAEAIVQAALSGNEATLARIYTNAGNHRSAVVRMWSGLTRCADLIAAADLSYEVFPESQPGLVRVDLIKDGRNVGELKMRFQEDEWRVFFTRYPTAYALGGCTNGVR